jgi:hypothetical protein
MVDRYTKVVLTVIAIALTVIAGKNVLSQSLAQSGYPTLVQICDAHFHCAEMTTDTSPRRVGEYGLRVIDGH